MKMGDSYSHYQAYVAANESAVKPSFVDVSKGLVAAFGPLESWRADTKVYDFGKVYRAADGRIVEHQATYANGDRCAVFQSEGDWFDYRKLLSAHQYLHG